MYILMRMRWWERDDSETITQRFLYCSVSSDIYCDSRRPARVSHHTRRRELRNLFDGRLAARRSNNILARLTPQTHTSYDRSHQGSGNTNTHTHTHAYPPIYRYSSMHCVYGLWVVLSLYMVICVVFVVSMVTHTSPSHGILCVCVCVCLWQQQKPVPRALKCAHGFNLMRARGSLCAAPNDERRTDCINYIVLREPDGFRAQYRVRRMLCWTYHTHAHTSSNGTQSPHSYTYIFLVWMRRTHQDSATNSIRDERTDGHRPRIIALSLRLIEYGLRRITWDCYSVYSIDIDGAALKRQSRAIYIHW